MKPKKIILNRAEFSTISIQRRQDFNSILTHVELLKNPTMKRPWFYGAVGFSSIAIAAFNLTYKLCVCDYGLWHFHTTRHFACPSCTGVCSVLTTGLEYAYSPAT